MKVFVDATGLTQPVTGLTNYSINLLREILTINRDIKFTILCSKLGSNNLTDFLEKDYNVTVIYANIPNVGPIRDLKYLTLYRLINKHDVYHCLSSYLPFFNIKIKTLITIHDLKYIKINDLMDNKIKTFYLKLLLKRSLKKANRIIAISKSTASDIKEVIGANKKTSIVYEANTLERFSLSISDKESNVPNFFLCIGENRPHKNYSRVIKSYASAYFSSDKNFPELYIAGNKVDELSELITEMGIEHKVNILGMVSNKKIFWLYQNAFALVYVSLYEGFGLPLLEAMSSKLPIITSDMHSTKEISGEAAYLVNPQSIEDISKGMIEMYQNDSLRLDYIQKGIEREKSFSWSKAAKQTYDIYDNMR